MCTFKSVAHQVMVEEPRTTDENSVNRRIGRRRQRSFLELDVGNGAGSQMSDALRQSVACIAVDHEALVVRLHYRTPTAIDVFILDLFSLYGASATMHNQPMNFGTDKSDDSERDTGYGESIEIQR